MNGQSHSLTTLFRGESRSVHWRGGWEVSKFTEVLSSSSYGNQLKMSHRHFGRKPYSEAVTKLTQCVSYSFLCGTTAQIGRRPPRFEVMSHRHTSPVGLTWASDQLVAQAATYTALNEHTRRTSMSAVGVTARHPGSQRLRTWVLRPRGYRVQLYAA
jgi:hypothetical protein